ncbi:chemotaxis protein CheX [Rhodovulum imhoffii]|uniref:Chemotaxis protein CheX n=2 Tax=Rhodovulum imhoffii TaxID=365340 RepID=A0A2T5BRI1_9RHOB|nr:STAS domain-containing protein [Rhodovulum imhoffii]PTN01888.1 chemotaxis protein CheX [Rhodovulum imhoffii]
MAPRRSPSAPDALYCFLNAARGRPVIIDVGRVEVVDAPRMQILLCAEREWRSAGVKFRLSNCTEIFRRGASMLGVDMEIFEQEPGA